jgi:hypothetical protein
MVSLFQPAKMRCRIGIVTVIGLAMLASSCGNGRKPVFPVHGQVLDAKQKPAVGALVIFHPVNADPKDPLKPLGKVDENGRFTLTTYREGDGAPTGEYVITITWPTPKKTPFDPEGGDQPRGRYANPERSSHRFTVENKPDHEVPTIRLQ